MAKTVEELQVFQKARAAGDALTALARETELRDDRDLVFQMNKGSVRIVSDLAEGFEQKTDRHFARYLYDAKGGAAEIRAQLGVALSRGLITESQRAELAARYEEVGRMLNGLIAHLERENRSDRRRAGSGRRSIRSDRRDK